MKLRIEVQSPAHFPTDDWNPADIACFSQFLAYGLWNPCIWIPGRFFLLVILCYDDQIVTIMKLWKK